jgi:hypothetical protein
MSSNFKKKSVIDPCKYNNLTIGVKAKKKKKELREYKRWTQIEEFYSIIQELNPLLQYKFLDKLPMKSL